MNSEQKTTGIYVHIPFCLSRCSYCDFATEIYRSEELAERYVQAVCKEIENFTEEAWIADTIYFGGGTPSLLKPQQLEKILKSIEARFSIAKDAEITLEINPANISLENLKAFRSLGINRTSFGVQTFDDYLLKILSRRHTSQDAIETFQLLRRAKFENISFDLIVGLPRQTLRGLQKDLEQAIKLRPEHLSLYILEVHEHTPLAEQIRSRRQPEPDEELTIKMYEIMTEKLTEADYLQYEISNFALRGFQSRHNLKYWLCLPVFGFGVSAFSYCDGQRWSNERKTQKYIELIESGKSAMVFKERINVASEFAFLALRLADGINLSEYKKRFGLALEEKYAAEIAEFQMAGLVEMKEGFLRLTQRGFLYSNEVFVIFV